VDEAEGRIFRFYATAASRSARTKTIQHVPTGVALAPGTSSAFVSTKSGHIYRFDRATLKPTPIRAGEGEGHKGDILAVAASEDGKWLVTGGKDKIVGVWDVSGKGAWVTGMKGHKDAVTVSLKVWDRSSHYSRSCSRH
jgi:ribosomal RNA-processing protein 9